MKKKKRLHRFQKFSRRYVMALLLFLQILLLAAMGFFMMRHKDQGVLFLCIYVIGAILNVIAVLRILYIHGDPEFKIPWIVALLAFPVVGFAFYLVFRTRPLPKRKRLLVEDIQNQVKKYAVAKQGKELAQEDSYCNAFALLESSSIFRVHAGNRIAYFSNGETFFPDFFEKLEKAKEFIFLEFFIVAEGKIFDRIHEILKRKVEEGVEVRFLYDDVGCFTTLPSDFYKTLQDEGIQCYPFNKVGFLLLGSYNNRSHRKIAVIDREYAYTGGMNLADEYANEEERFGYWKDTMIRMEGPVVRSMIGLFLSDFDLARDGVISDYDAYMDGEFPSFDGEGLALAFGTGPENFYPMRLGEANYIAMINSAKRTIDVSTPYFIPSGELRHALEGAALRGVRVRLFLPQIPDKQLPYLIAKYHIPYLLKAGVQVFFFTPGFNHMKTMLVDGCLAFVGTINMDYRSLVHHFENGVTWKGGSAMGDIAKDFEEMAKVSSRVPMDFSLAPLQKFLVALVSLFIPLL